MTSDWVLVYLGEGPMKRELEAAVNRAGLAESVKFVGQNTSVEKWLGASEFYVSPSHWEGLSNTLLEAMATGLPALVTRVSTVGELIEEPGAGLVVPVGDVDALSVGLIQMVQDPVQRLAWGRAGRAAILARYSIEAVAQNYEKMYYRLNSCRG